MSVNAIVRTFCVSMLLSGCLFGQSSTGSLLRVVADPSDAAITKALVELKNTATGAVTTTTTEAEGIFRFNSLVPATYTLTIKAPAGFKTYEQSNIEVTANEVRDLGKLSLAMGAMTEQVSVVAAATPIQTASAENSKLIDNNQLSKITLKGRDLFGLMVTMPGVNVTQRDTTSENSIGSVRSSAPQLQRELHRRWHHQPRHWLQRNSLTLSRTSIPSPKCACSPRTTRPSTAAIPTASSAS